MYYNFTKNSLECQRCPKNTFSTGGSFRISGNNREWSETILNTQFDNKCYTASGESGEHNCKGWSVSKDGKYISTNKAYNTKAYHYVASLSTQAELVSPGEIHFKYKKNTITQNSFKVGFFRFYIDYTIYIEDSNVNSNDWVEANFPLSPGKHSFLWQYFKYVSTDASDKLKMTISDILITHLDTASLSCERCIGGTSQEGSEYCTPCIEKEYFDTEKSQCLKCPPDTSSAHHSIGIESCKKIPQCKENSYVKIFDQKCNIKTGKQKLHYELLSQSNCVESSSFLKDVEVGCKKCPVGKYKRKIDDTYSTCEYCPSGKYSSEEDSDKCEECQGIISNVLYLTPDEGVRFQDEVEIINVVGEMTIKYNVINADESYSLYLEIDSVPYDGRIISDSTKITLSEGVHKITLEANNVLIQLITITNTSNGGGAKCLPCTSGFLIKEPDKYICIKCGSGMEIGENGECKVCPKGYYKYVNDHFEKCQKCPKFTQPNSLRTNCIPIDVAYNSQYKLQYVLNNYDKYQEDLCKMTNNLCYENFYGPIREKGTSNLFFISFRKPNYFLTTDFSYKYKHEKEHSFVYLLSTTKSDDKIDSTKIITSLGKEIKYIKMVNTEANKGVIINYNNGDICEEDLARTYSTVLFLNCTKSQNELMNYHSPRFISKSNCTYYFEWASREGCPICLESEVDTVKLRCVNFERFVLFSEGPKCIINKTSDLEINSIEEEDPEEEILMEDIDDIQKVYSIDLSNARNMPLPSPEDVFINKKKEVEVCYLYDDFDKEILIIVILVPIFYICIVILCIYFWCKYRRISGDYHRLMEEPVPSGSNIDNAFGQGSGTLNQHIEMASQSNVTEKNGSASKEGKVENA